MGQRAGSSGRAVERAAILQQKRKVLDAVRMRFARFGDEVLAIVLGFALKPRSMPVLMQRLGLRPSGDLNSQLDAIWEYIAQTSTREFLKHVKRVDQHEVEAIDINKLLAGAAQELQANPAADAGPQKLLSGEAPEAEADASAPIPPLVYNGPERRGGGDRRRKQDRRSDIDAVERNRRFGGERRKRPRGRRKTDQSR